MFGDEPEAAASVGSSKARGIKRVGGNARVNGKNLLPEEDSMLRIQRSANGEVVFTLSGRMDEEAIAQLETLIRSETNGSRIVLDLKDLFLVGQEAISFLERCEAGSITLKNCGGYISARRV
jgi:hypothetical protein